MKIKIGYNKLIVSLPVLLALLLSVMAMLSRNKGSEVSESTYFLIIGLLMLSIPMYFIPYIVVTDTEIRVNNQWAMPARRARINGLKDIRVEGTTIYVKTDDFERALRYNKFMVDAKQLRNFKKLLDELKSKDGGASA